MELAKTLQLAGVSGAEGLGPLGAIFGALGAKNERHGKQNQYAANAFAQGRQDMLDMKNGLELDDSDRQSIADSIDKEKLGYGEY